MSQRLRVVHSSPLGGHWDSPTPTAGTSSPGICTQAEVLSSRALALCRGFTAVSLLLAVGALGRGRRRRFPGLLLLLIEEGVADLRRGHCKDRSPPSSTCHFALQQGD
ncbi:uncharacterized protein [Miscanthus floridulus]|uniref:uncharacterized protein n=1 Tax=Miscanthus floridulus TaxID=154761 RepID=UPI00345A86FB